jgi:hypothetical protein
MVIHAVRSHRIGGADRRPSGRAIIVRWLHVVIYPEASLVLILREVQNRAYDQPKVAQFTSYTRYLKA